MAQLNASPGKSGRIAQILISRALSRAMNQCILKGT
jgi:hypothetical protein